MALKVYTKNNAGRRNMSVVKSPLLTDKKPEKSLLAQKNRQSGRSNGKISVRHQGGGHKKRYRIVDFKQDKINVPGRVVSIEKDPNRSAFIALINYRDGEKRYILASEGMEEGKEIMCAPDAPVEPGNRAMIKNIPVGTIVSNVELFPGKGGQIIRSAGAGAPITAVEGNTAQIKFASGEVRMLHSDCYATIGKVSNFEHNAVTIGKAGRIRWMGVRPTVRGTAMNPVDHPHGGGEGRQGIGLKHPKTPWGKPALGKRTRKKKRYSNKYILKRRSR